MRFFRKFTSRERGKQKLSPQERFEKSSEQAIRTTPSFNGLYMLINTLGTLEKNWDKFEEITETIERVRDGRGDIAHVTQEYGIQDAVRRLMESSGERERRERQRRQEHRDEGGDWQREHEESPEENERKKDLLERRIRESKSYGELYGLIREIRTTLDDIDVLTPQEVIERIESVRDGRGSIFGVPREYGIQDAVRQFVENDKKENEQKRDLLERRIRESKSFGELYEHILKFETIPESFLISTPEEIIKTIWQVRNGQRSALSIIKSYGIQDTVRRLAEADEEENERKKDLLERRIRESESYEELYKLIDELVTIPKSFWVSTTPEEIIETIERVRSGQIRIVNITSQYGIRDAARRLMESSGEGERQERWQRQADYGERRHQRHGYEEPTKEDIRKGRLLEKKIRKSNSFGELYELIQDLGTIQASFLPLSTPEAIIETIEQVRNGQRIVLQVIKSYGIQDAVRRLMESSEERGGERRQRQEYRNERRDQQYEREESARKELGVTSDASWEEIKVAYRRLAMKHHPDREGGNEEEFIRIRAAYETLQRLEEG